MSCHKATLTILTSGNSLYSDFSQQQQGSVTYKHPSYKQAEYILYYMQYAYTIVHSLYLVQLYTSRWSILHSIPLQVVEIVSKRICVVWALFFSLLYNTSQWSQYPDTVQPQQETCIECSLLCMYIYVSAAHSMMIMNPISPARLDELEQDPGRMQGPLTLKFYPKGMSTMILFYSRNDSLDIRQGSLSSDCAMIRLQQTW